MNLKWTRDALTVAVTAAAAFRLTRLWLRDSLPGVVDVREAAVAALEERAPDGEEHPLLPLTYCAWCAGFWISAAVVAVASTPQLAPLWRPLSTVLAVSAVVGVASAHDE